MFSIDGYRTAVLKSALSIAVLAVAASVAAGTSGAATHNLTFAANSTVAPQVSSNWSGYAIFAADETTPVSFSDVTGTWVQPKSTCTIGRQSSSAFWVGLGGYDESSNALEQLGTGSDCDGNTTKPTYYAWWEIVPAASVQIPYTVKAGDTMTSAVVVNGQKVVLFLKDVTRKWRFSKTVTTTQQLDTTSAEWIAEAPSDCSSFGRCRVVPLTNFGTVNFTNAAAIGNAHAGTINDPAWTSTPIELIADGGHAGLFGQNSDAEAGIGAVPGDVSSDGRGFSVSWQQNLTPPTQ